jgi:photosystem II stability/assembly factor-like uncharacterized protein
MGVAWKKVADLPDRAGVGAVRASADGYGLLGIEVSGEKGTPAEKLKASRAAILRATADGTAPRYEGAGWIVSLDGAGAVWFAVQATLKSSGSGSDYKLLRSTDGGLQWEERAVIAARSVKSVLAIDVDRAWVHGAGLLAATKDGGESWTPVKLSGDRDPTRERLRRDGKVIAVAADGAVHASADGGATFRSVTFPGGAAYDIASGRALVSSEAGEVTIAPLETAGPVVTIPMKDRQGLRLVVDGLALRVLSRGADPSKGARMMIHESHDGGRSWSHTPIVASPRCDIAGMDFGVGDDNMGGVLFAPVLDS